MEPLNTYWNDILRLLEAKSSPVSYDTWFRPIVAHSIQDNILYLYVSQKLVKEMLEKRHFPLLCTCVYEVMGREMEVVILTGEEQPLSSNKEGQAKANGQVLAAKNANIPKNLNPNYIFSSFVVGNSNRMAHAASLAVAEAPATNYNPLFLYGNSGLGKTHLMHSIAHFILDQNPEAKVLYVTSEAFTNEMILSIQNNKNEEFRNKYRNIDVLLIDDIQFISKKEMTQEEFFHTFNELHGSSKQVIISSDRPPKEIETLEERLRSRFEMGLIADIQPPDYETRIAILRKKAEHDGLEISNDVMAYIAKHIASNIRELEGALTRIVAFATLTNQEITIALAEASLKDIFSENVAKPLSPQLIQEIVAGHFGIRVEDLQGSKKPKNIAFPRQICMYLCRKLLDISLPKIGEHFGGRDHTTVIHAVSKIEKQLDNDTMLQGTILQLEKEINGNG